MGLNKDLSLLNIKSQNQTSLVVSSYLTTRPNSRGLRLELVAYPPNNLPSFNNTTRFEGIKTSKTESITLFLIVFNNTTRFEGIKTRNNSLALDSFSI